MADDDIPIIDTNSHSENVGLLAAYRSEIRFETELLSGRLNAFLSAQSFLIIAYATSMSGALDSAPYYMVLVPLPLALLGLILSIYAWPSIRTSYESISKWQERQEELLTSRTDIATYWPTSGPQRGRYDPSLMVGLQRSSLFARHTPWIFSIAWIYFGGLAFFWN